MGAILITVLRRGFKAHELCDASTEVIEDALARKEAIVLLEGAIDSVCQVSGQ